MSHPPPRGSRAGPSRRPVPPSARALAMSPAPQQVQVSAAEPSRWPEKRRRLEETDPANHSPVNPRSVMAATRGAAREAMVQEAVLRRIKIATSQPSVGEGFMPDPELAEVVKRLLGYL